MRSLVAPAVISLALATACGGSSDSTTEPTQTNVVANGTFRASVNGSAWSPAGRVAVNKSTNNIVAIAAVSSTYTISLALTPLTAPGTFSLNFGNTTGSLAIVSSAGGQGWSTVAQGSTGSVVITTYTASRIAGTFSFDAVGISGGATGTLHVTNGTFDVTY